MATDTMIRVTTEVRERINQLRRGRETQEDVVKLALVLLERRRIARQNGREAQEQR